MVKIYLPRYNPDTLDSRIRVKHVGKTARNIDIWTKYTRIRTSVHIDINHG